MAKLQYHAVAALLLLLVSISSSSSLAPDSEPTASVDPSAAANLVRSVGDEEAPYPKNEVLYLEKCSQKLGQNGAAECMATMYDVLGRNEGSSPDLQCCKNIVGVERFMPECWDVFFPGNQPGRRLVPGLVGFCTEAILTAPPSPRPVA